MANSGVAGYFGGGFDSGLIDGIDKITFPADTRTTLSAVLTSPRATLAAMAANGSAGYFGGGEAAAGARLSGIDKITFPADSKTTLSATLTTARTSPTGMADGGV